MMHHLCKQLPQKPKEVGIIASLLHRLLNSQCWTFQILLDNVAANKWLLLKSLLVSYLIHLSEVFLGLVSCWGKHMELPGWEVVHHPVLSNANVPLGWHCFFAFCIIPMHFYLLLFAHQLQWLWLSKRPFCIPGKGFKPVSSDHQK